MCNSNSIASFNRKRPEKLKTPWTNYFFCLLLGSFSEKKGGTCGKESIRIPCSTGPAHWAWDLCCLGHFHPCRMRPNHSLTLAFYSVWTVQPFTIRLCQQLADSFDIWLQITRRWSVCQSGCRLDLFYLRVLRQKSGVTLGASLPCIIKQMMHFK